MHRLATSVYQDAMSACVDVETRAHDVLESLRERAPSSASAISLWDPLARRHVTLANHDYPDDVMEHLNTWFVHNDPLFRRMECTESGALRWRDFPDYRQSHSVTEVFTPAGFDEGLSARLVTANGTYAGTIHVNSDDRRYPRDDDVREVNMLRTQLASWLDITEKPGVVAEFLAPGQPAWLIDEQGRCQPLDDRQPESPSGDPDLVATVVGRIGTEQQFRWREPEGNWLCVRAIPAARRYRGAPATALLIVTRQDLPFGLTHRELDVATLLVQGLTTSQIARRLVISERTAGHHIEHLLAKMNAPNRIAASAVASRHGLISGRLDARAQPID